MRVTLGEVNRNILSLRRDFREYVDVHVREHRDHEEDHDTAGRWLVATAVSIIGLSIAVVTAIAAVSQP